MNIKTYIVTLCFATALCFNSISAQSLIIPKPEHLTLHNSEMKIGKQISLSIVGVTSKKEREDLKYILHQALGSNVKIVESTKSPNVKIVLRPLSTNLGAEGYKLEVKSSVELSAISIAGLKHGLQTLGQLYDGQQTLKGVTIEDKPAYEYRGVMLDVSRHFFPTSFIKGLLDEMARLKLNRFHWHLVDGGGWRMESKTYPKLTKLSAFRTESDWDKWWGGRDRRFVPEGTQGAYGGYYTQDEIKEVVAYATRLGITVIPEIELPGHSNELFFSYPNLFCTGADYKTATDVCIGNEETFTFFTKILDETMALFPSKDIHIGGDEATMDLWKTCPRCKARMEQEGIKDVHGLQSYMIHRIEKYLNSKGRNLVGWDEILMGGLAPNATVMSWRGEEGGIAAVKAGHKVIMTPNSHLYLDFYQGNPATEPRAIGGYTPLERVYSYVPPKIENAKGQIIGIQANLWTEYISSPEHVSYMLFPRVVALSEVAWTPKEKQNYDDFLSRIVPYLSGLQARGQNPYQLTGIRAESDTKVSIGRELKGYMNLSLRPERPDARVVVDLNNISGIDSKQSSLLAEGVTLGSSSNSQEVRANVYLGDKLLTSQNYRVGLHKGLWGYVSYNCKWNQKYKANGENTLNDGVDGGYTYLDGAWQGFTEPMDVTIKLPYRQLLNEVSMRFLAEREQWVYMPQEVEVLVSSDGENYFSLGKQTPKTNERNPRPIIERFAFRASHEAVRYVRVKASIGRSPGHFIFCDEIVIL